VDCALSHLDTACRETESFSAISSCDHPSRFCDFFCQNHICFLLFSSSFSVIFLLQLTAILFISVLEMDWLFLLQILSFFPVAFYQIGLEMCQLAVTDAYFSRISRICCIIFLIS
jgi:hypothetical protein